MCFKVKGRKRLAYTINRVHKAHYILMNIECAQATLEELESAFRFNDSVMRHLVLLKKNAIIERSILAKDEVEAIAHDVR